MAIFKKASPEDALEALRVRAGKLESRRAVAQTDLDAALARRQKHLLEADLDGDDRAIERLERDVVTASTRLGGLVDAISALNVQISEHEHRIQLDRDQAERKAASERILAQVVDFEARLDPLLSAMKLFADVCEPLESAID
jgi:predicted  nucleic acid-binding Zn-ribbon protein